jgi:superfamily II DNA or RNA helicase
MAVAKLIIRDEVNVGIRGIDPYTSDLIWNRLSYYVPDHFFKASSMIGRWDGMIRLYKKRGNRTFLNLLKHVIPILVQQGYEVEIIEDNREDYNHVSKQLTLIDENSFSGYTFNEEPLVVRDYQIESTNRALKEGSGVLEMATGSGKTLVCAILSKLYSLHGNVVVIVPTIDLILQTRSAFKQLGIEAGIWYGQTKEKERVTIGTWQSIDHFPELFDGVICFIVDEVHKAKAKVVNEMLTGPGAKVPFRFGCTGTMPKEELFKAQIEASIGPTIFELKAWQLQEQGVLADASILQMELNDKKNPKYKRKFPENKPMDWKTETDWLFSQPDRVNCLTTAIQQIAQNGNTLVLINFRAYGKVLQESIPGSISLDGRDKNRIDIYKEFNDGDDGILICTTGIASTGIDIPRIFNLVVIEPGKKFESINQILGRGLRKTKDKTHLNVYDLHGNGKYCLRHARIRRRLYMEARQPYETITMDYHDVNTVS